MKEFFYSVLIISAVLADVFPYGKIRCLFCAIVIIVMIVITLLNPLVKYNPNRDDEPKKADFNVDEAKAASSYDLISWLKQKYIIRKSIVHLFKSE